MTTPLITVDPNNMIKQNNFRVKLKFKSNFNKLKIKKFQQNKIIHKIQSLKFKY